MTDVRWATDDQVLHAVLDGEATMNSIDPGVLDGLDAMMDAVDADPSLRAVVITGAGEKAFSVGMDLDFLGRCFHDPDGVFLPFLDRFHGVLRRLERLPVPVVAEFPFPAWATRPSEVAAGADRGDVPDDPFEGLS